MQHLRKALIGLAFLATLSSLGCDAKLAALKSKYPEARVACILSYQGHTMPLGDREAMRKWLHDRIHALESVSANAMRGDMVTASQANHDRAIEIAALLKSWQMCLI